jgi:hypothetical protein
MLKEKTNVMSKVATSHPIQRESGVRKAPGTAKDSRSQEPQTLMYESITKLAYALWQQRGCPYGSPEFDWLEAERTLNGTPKMLSL